MKKTSLYEHHVQLKAKMAPFAGFEMPLQYSSVKEEVLAVRNAAGVFDVGHMGEFFVEGPDAVKFVDTIIVNEFANTDDNKAVYSPLCRDDGSVVDDLIAYKVNKEKVLICVNASNTQKDWEWIGPKVCGFNCKIFNRSDDYSLLALQGPQTEEILAKLEILPKIPYYAVAEKSYLGSNVIMARTGYTGEDGFELFSDHQTIKKLWEKFMEMGITPCGLVSRDILRLEVCYPLYGHELSDEWTPIDAGLKWTVRLEKDNFIGKRFLTDYVPKYRQVKLSLEKGIPREGYKLENETGATIGWVTSGSMSVTLNKGIALGLVEKEKFPKDKKFFIRIRNNAFEAQLHTKPFVIGGHK